MTQNFTPLHVIIVLGKSKTTKLINKLSCLDWLLTSNSFVTNM